MRGPVREEKEAYSVPVIPGLCFCPFLLAQAVSYIRNSHSLGCCILWITVPAWPGLGQLGMRSCHRST